SLFGHVRAHGERLSTDRFDRPNDLVGRFPIFAVVDAHTVAVLRGKYRCRCSNTPASARYNHNSAHPRRHVAPRLRTRPLPSQPSGALDSSASDRQALAIATRSAAASKTSANHAPSGSTRALRLRDLIFL